MEHVVEEIYKLDPEAEVAYLTKDGFSLHPDISKPSKAQKKEDKQLSEKRNKSGSEVADDLEVLSIDSQDLSKKINNEEQRPPEVATTENQMKFVPEVQSENNKLQKTCKMNSKEGEKAADLLDSPVKPSPLLAITQENGNLQLSALSSKNSTTEQSITETSDTLQRPDKLRQLPSENIFLAQLRSTMKISSPIGTESSTLSGAINPSQKEFVVKIKNRHVDRYLDILYGFVKNQVTNGDQKKIEIMESKLFLPKKLDAFNDDVSIGKEIQ